MKRYIIAAIFLAVASLQAQDTIRFSLKEAVAFAEKNSPVYQNIQTDVSLSRETVKQVQAMGLPQISGSAGFNQYVQIPGSWAPNFFGGPDQYIFLKFQQKYNATVGVTANQLLWDGTYLLGLKAAQEYVNLSQLMVAKTKLELQTNVAKAYLLALTTAKNIELLNSNLSTLEKSYNDVKALYDEGFAELLDVQRLQLAVSNLKVQKEKLQNAANMTLDLLKLQIGIDMEKPMVLTDKIETVDTEIALSQPVSTEFSINNRIEYKIINQGLTLSKMDEKRYKLGYLPTLVGFVSHQRTANRSEFNFFESNLTPNNNFIPATLWGLSLQVPIFDGLKKQSQIASVRLNRMKTENDLRNFTNAATMENINARNAYLTNLKQTEEQKKNLDLAKSIYDKANLKFKEGVGSTLEIMQAETDLKAAQTNYLNALYDLVVSKIDLKKSTGENIL